MIVDILLFVSFLATAVYAFKIWNKKKAAAPVVINGAQKVASGDEDKKEEAGLPMSIFFGSQSGTAETFSQELADEARLHGFNPKVIDLEEYDTEDLSEEKFAVFLMATFGEGEPTDNAVEFWEWAENCEDNYSKGVPFAVFALGNKQYEHFCNIGRNLDQLLHKKGGLRVVEHGEGDDDADLEADFNEWKEKFWKATHKQFGLEDISDSGPATFKPQLTYTEMENDCRYDTEKMMLQDTKTKPSWLRVVESRELRNYTEDGGSTLHIELDITDHTGLFYTTADNLGIMPRNCFKRSAKLLKRLNTPADTFFSLTASKGGKSAFHAPMTARDAMLYHVDFSSTPRTKLVELLAGYATDAKEKIALLKMATEDKDVLHEQQYSVEEILHTYKSIDIPFNHFLEMAPRMLPRYYTISSSSKAKPGTISVTVALLKTEKPDDRYHEGVTTHYLTALKPGKDSVCCFIRPSTFRLPVPLKEQPIIMVGPGTGIAPFRGFVQEFTHLFKENGQKVSCSLYFGSRHSDKDYLYKDELSDAEDNGVLTQLNLAFSRQTKKKVYVQHLMEGNGKKLWNDMRKENGYMYVCGATAMGRSVRDAMKQIACTEGGMTDEEAHKWLEKMQKGGRYVQELWA